MTKHQGSNEEALLIETELGTVDLEDSTVSSISRSHGEVRFICEPVRLIRSSGTERIDSAAIVLRGVRTERARFFIGDRVEVPHPNPLQPLDSIAVVVRRPPHLILQGYLGNEPWYVWEIEAQEIAIEPLSESGAADE